jgi:lipopolysaccharide/colanic/teichoic acid biosynthesis glycosyltransferase
MKNLIKNGKPMEKLKNDKRIIPFGNFLRYSCLDELPQLFNILRGEMSLVGPRPDIPESLEYYQQWHKKRFQTVQGLTGFWQVSGKNNMTFDEMVRLDITYIEKRSFFLDIKLMLRTVLVVFKELSNEMPKQDTENMILSDGYSNRHL